MSQKLEKKAHSDLDDKEKNIYAGVRLEGLYTDAINTEMFEMSFFEFEIFESYLDALLLKLDNKKSKEVESNVLRLEWMKRFLHRQRYKNRIQELQSGLIHSMKADCVNYELQIIDLQKQIERFKN